MSWELFGQAVSLHRQGRLEDAGRICLLIQQQGGPVAFEARYLLAFLRYQQGRLGEALQAVEAALSGDPTVAKALLLHGTLLHAAGKPVEALAQLTAAAARDPGNVEIWYGRGVLLGGMARHEDALTSFDKALSIRPTAECWNNRGAALQSLKRWPEALQSFDSALALKPDYVPVWMNRGAALQALKRYEDAVVSYDKALHVAPDYVPAIVQRAIALQSLYRMDEAVAGTEAEIQPGRPAAPSTRARALARLGEAEAGLRQAVTLDPNLAEAHANLGNVLREQGRLDAAEASYRRAIALQADEVGAHIGLGNVLNDRGDLQGAIDCYRRALALNPDIAEAHNNCGNALNDLGRPEEAIACYQKALALMPDLVQARNNIAVVLRSQGKLEEAKAIFRHILQRQPADVTALDNLASLLSMQGDVVTATNIICQSLKVQPTQKAQRIFVDVIRNGRLIENNDTMRSLMVRALTEPWGRPSDLAQTGAQLLKLDAYIGPCVARAVAAWPDFPSAQALYGTDGPASLSNNPVLCALLSSTQNPDVELERFLTAARYLLLEAAIGAVAGTDGGEALSFYGALAQQCFINEYVFSQGAKEGRQVDDLCARLTAALEAGAPVSALWVTAIAAYRPLGSVPLAARLLDRQLPEPVAALLAQQIIDPQAEALSRAKIPRLTAIADGVSRKVRELYEENPYPRWVRNSRGEAFNSIGAYLYRKFPLASYQRQAGISADILIAGCGTGQHAIEVARRFRDGRVLAIDLSLSSLAYAKRKSQELGLTNIEYSQADILELGGLGRDFDLIEAAGVLHHMADPYAAWETLSSLLRPGGFMLVGLYSEVARRDILRARDFIAARQFEPVPQQIRQCRQEIMASGEADNLTSLLKMSDFFSISTCRDLLFHVQEHYVSLAGIDGYLRAQGLTLMGFEISPNVLHAYRQRFPNDPAATDLAQWQVFENENPDTFSSMYQFWIQKPA